MARHGAARPEKIRLGMFEWTLIGTAVIAGLATLLYLVGLARGDRIDSGPMPFLMAFAAVGCTGIAYTLATAAPVRPAAPEPVGAPAVLRV
ncbi:hypothetical protein KIH27_00750 [Mycobacterium sp. M1]|uniref:Uncharacterized protein n=1 Tax=Mycolicibacter acidiphilus TaxID=2835306 RepID=A0ABS5RCU3_9MYCO|nr:hypothetical protein [Mycolicibacter acidiphilus]MBS9532111.1 hypothetical protein [Mycolicibacter acidiphilus]